MEETKRHAGLKQHLYRLPFCSLPFQKKCQLVNFLTAIIQLCLIVQNHKVMSHTEDLSSLVLIRNLLGKGLAGKM